MPAEQHQGLGEGELAYFHQIGPDPAYRRVAAGHDHVTGGGRKKPTEGGRVGGVVVNQQPAVPPAQLSECLPHLRRNVSLGKAQLSS